MKEECVIAIRGSDITYEELKKIYENSILFSFSENSLKKKVHKKWLNEIQTFE